MMPAGPFVFRLGDTPETRTIWQRGVPGFDRIRGLRTSHNGHAFLSVVGKGSGP